MRKINNCKINGQILCLIGLFFQFNLFAQNVQNQDVAPSRGPASFLPSEDINPLSFSQELWIESAFKEDSAGILFQMKETINGWNETEAFIKRWGLDDDNELYKKTEASSKKNYITKYLLKYIDKRISSEIKTADANSTMFKVGQAKEALSPSSDLSFSPLFKLKLRAKVLQGLLTARVINPWLDFSINATLSGKLNFDMNKTFDDLHLKVGSRLDVTSNESEFFFEQSFPSNVVAKVSSVQKLSSSPFISSGEQKIEVLYSYSF